MRWLLRGGLLLFALGAVGAFLLLKLPGEAPAAQVAAEPGSMALAWRMGEPGSDACQSCHFGWTVPVNLTAVRTGASEGNGSYRVNVSPVSGYELAAAAIAPVQAGGAVPRVETHEVRLELAPVQPASAAWTPAAPAVAVFVEALPGTDFERPDLSLTVRVGGIEVEAPGTRFHKRVLVRAPDAAGFNGPVRADVSVADARDVPIGARVRFTAFPLGFEVHENVTRGAPASYAWAGGAGEVPEAFEVAFIAWNDHPDTRWAVTASGDSARFRASVFTGNGSGEPADKNLPQDEREDPWAGEDVVVLHEERFDGVQALQRNERGEWASAVVNPSAIRGPMDALSAGAWVYKGIRRIPPGATEVRTILTWEPRTPASPAPNWSVGVSYYPLPEFFWPDPTFLESGKRVDVFPVTKAQWGEGADWISAYAVLAVDAGGRAAFDGTYAFRVEALRPPVAGQTP